MATSKTRITARRKRRDLPLTSPQGAGDEQARVLQALFRIAECVGSHRSSAEKLDTILEIVREVCGARSARLTEPNDTEGRVGTVASAGHWPTGEGRHRTIKAVFATGEPKVIDGPGIALGAGVASRAALPIVLNGRVTHVLMVNAGTEGFFTPERMRFLRSITDSLGPLLENIRLQEAERAQSRKIDALYSITASLSSESLDDGAAAALESARDLVGLRGCALWVPNVGTEELYRFAEAHVDGPRVAAPILDFHERGTVGRAYMTAEPVIENDYPPSAHAKRSGRKDTTRAAASFPLKEHGQVIAIVTYLSDRSHAFDEPTLALLRATAEALGTSFGRRRLRHIERRKNETLEALHSIARVLAEPGSFVDQVTAVLEEVKTVLEVDSADLRMPDVERAGLCVVASVGSALQPLGTFRAYGDSRSGTVFQRGTPIIAHDYEVNHRGGPDRGRRTRSGYEAKSVAWLPVKAAGRTMGVLAVDTARHNHFTAERVQLLTTIADEIGVFIENAKLREAERLHLQELEVLNRAATIFAGDGIFQAKAKNVLEAIVGLAGDWASLRVPDESGEHLSLVASTRSGGGGERSSRVRFGMDGEALSRREPVVANEYVTDPRARRTAIDYGVRSRAAFPVMVNGLPHAVVNVSSRLPNYFTPERVAVLATIAVGIGQPLERARLEEQMHAAEALRESEERYRNLFESATVGIVVTKRERGIVQTNPAFERMLGRTNEELRGTRLSDYRLGDHQPPSANAFERLASGETDSVSYEREFVHSSGDTVWTRITATGVPNPPSEMENVFRMVEDITEKKRAEEALRESEERYRALFESAPVGISVTQPKGGKGIRQTNPALERMLGRTKEELKGTRLSDYRLGNYGLGDDHAMPSAHSFQLLATGETDAVRYERQLVQSDGEILWAQITAVAVPSQTGQTEHIFRIIEDITDRKEAERALQEAETERLERTRHLASIGELAAGVAHEINNPLNSMLGFTQLLMDQDLPSQARSDLETIYAEGKRATGIVQNLLAFARSPDPVREAVDFGRVIGRASALKAYDLRRSNVDLRTDVPKSLPSVWGDEQRLVQVVLNLLSNAEQAIAAAARPGVVTVSCSASDDQIQLRVSDDGPGIPSEVIGRIFEPFFTTKEVGEGTGLGLSVCQSIVRQHDGELWAESSPGEGATFYMVLPVGVGAPSRSSVVPAADARPAPRMRILVVDDEPAAREFMARALMRDHHDVETASGGEDALRRLQAAPFDCVVTDIRMPGMSGPELHRHTEATDPDLASRFIFVTGDTASGDTLEFLSSTANRHLMKPIDAAELRMQVAELREVTRGRR